MRKCVSWAAFWYGSFILLGLLALSNAKSRRGEGYDNSFAFLNVRSPHTTEEGVRFCVNYQQYDDPTRPLPNSVQTAKSWHLSSHIDICKNESYLSFRNKKFAEDEIVYANYCSKDVDYKFEVALMSNRMKNISHALFVVERGRPNKEEAHDFLFSQFRDYTIGKYGPNSSFFIYNDTFFNRVLPLIYGTKSLGSHTDRNQTTNAKLRFYRPQSLLPMDAGLGVLFLLAVGAVLLGSVWGAYDTWAEMNVAGARLREESSVENFDNLAPTDSTVISSHPSDNKSPQSVSDQPAATKDLIDIVDEENARNNQTSTTILDRESARHDDLVNVEVSGSSSVVAVPIVERSASRSDQTQPKKRKEQKKTEAAAELAGLGCCEHCCYVAFFLVMVGAILMLAYFFRNYTIVTFNILVLILGTFSVHKCVYTLLQIIFSKTRSHGGQDFDVELFSLSQIFCALDTRKNVRTRPSKSTATPTNIGKDGVEKNDDVEKNRAVKKDGKTKRSKTQRTCAEKVARWNICASKLRLLSVLLFCGSAAFCLAWFVLRQNHYSFLMLDSINFCLCIYAIRSSMCRSMRLITFLLSAMFIYDLFMVFGTKVITSDGCSVMIQVATGMNCAMQKSLISLNVSGNSTEFKELYAVLSNVPIAPIDLPNPPPKIPIVFYVPYISDPMRECYDVNIEKGFNFMLLGLGDVILPGYLVAYCFYIDIAKRHRFHSFGIIACLGYAMGVLTTFVALHVMQVGQPALIYIVPSTLIPILLWAWLKGMLREVWKGGDLTQG